MVRDGGVLFSGRTHHGNYKHHCTKTLFFFFNFCPFSPLRTAVLKAKGVFVDKIIKILFLGKTDLALKYVFCVKHKHASVFMIFITEHCGQSYKSSVKLGQFNFLWLLDYFEVGDKSLIGRDLFDASFDGIGGSL